MKLRDFLTDRGLRACDLAELMGVSEGTVSRWLSEDKARRRIPSAINLARLERLSRGMVGASDFVTLTEQNGR